MGTIGPIGSVRRARARSGFAILMVVLVLVGLVIIGAPFALWMRQEELAAINFAARAQAKLAATGALNIAKAQLERSHELYERMEAEPGRPETVYNSPYVDSTGELRVNFHDESLPGTILANPAGTMWSASAQDEQAKVNLNSATRPLLAALIAQVTGETIDPANPGATRAEKIAIELHRDPADPIGKPPFTSLAQARQASTLITDAEFQRLTRFLTLHSAPLVGEVPAGAPPLHPVNINTCSEEVLRALLLGIKLYQPDKNPADRHKGVGYATQGLDTDGDGTPDKTVTDDFNALIARLRVFGKLAADVGPASTEVAVKDLTAPLPNPVAGEGYWVSIEGDAVRYNAKTDTSLAVWFDPKDPTHPLAARVDKERKYDPLEPVEVRLLFTDIEHDLAGVLAELVKEEKLTPDSKAAILACAVNPRNATVLDLTTTTAPICTHSFNIYTIEATGIVNAPDGRERARYTIREVAQVAPSVDLEIRIDSQEDFERSFQAGLARHQATWPNPTQVSDVAPRASEPPEASFVARHGRLGLPTVEHDPTDPVRLAARFTARYNGELLDETLLGDKDGGRDTLWPEPFKDLTTVKTTPGDDSDLGPEGLHVGRVAKPDGSGTETRTIAYTARVDGAKDAQGKAIDANNVPHSSDNVVLPLIIEMWVKFDADPTVAGDVKFDYARDRVLFDLGQQPYSNRLALLYYGRDNSSGDLVLHACDSTNQPIAAQVRCRVGREAAPGVFQLLPERWYHVTAIAKGIRYNEIALLINGRSVGAYFPVARTSGVAADAPAIPCAVTPNDDPRSGDATAVFRHQPWPLAGAAVLGGEIVEYTGISSGLMSILTDAAGSPVGRGSRGTLARAHADGTRIEIHGYTDYIHKDSSETGEGDIEHLLLNMMDASQEPSLVADLPADFPQVTVKDDDETNPAGAPAPTAVTQSGTTQFWDQFSASYQAATGLADNTIPSGDWLPIFASEKWIVPSATDGGTLADDETKFKTVLDDPGFLSMLTWTQQRPTTAQRTIEEPVDGIGLITLEANPDPLEAKDREAIKFAKAGIVLVWRYYPGDVDNPDTPTDDRRQIAWYIGYLAGFNVTDGTTYAGRRACFDTPQATIVEGAKIRLNCIKLSSNHDLPRGHRGTQAIEHKLVGTDQTVVENRPRNGRGIFQLVYRDAQGNADVTKPFEWIQFTYPCFPWPPVPDGQENVEEKVLAGKFLYDISRAVANTGDADHKPVAFPAASAKVMPVFFCSGYVHVMGNDLVEKDMDLVKGSHDEVTLTDNTGQREDHWVHHGWGRMFAFRESIPPLAVSGRAFSYANRPRLIKFPAGLPIKPDKLFYLGSDALYKDGDPKAPAHDGPAAGEPERPANATFDEVKIYSAAYGTARLWDCKQTGGAPDPAKHIRSASGITSGMAPPFYIRIGNLESFVPKDAAEPFRFHSNGHVGAWPLDGYLKIDDEVFFYRVIYRRPNGRHSAPIKFTRPLDGDGNPVPFPNDLVTVLDEDDTKLLLDLTEDEAKDFPDMGYLTISNAWANLDYWNRVREIMTTYGVTWDAIEKDLAAGEEVRSADGKIIYGSHYIGSEERVFFNGKRYDTSKNALELTLTHRGILNSTPKKVQMYDPATTGGWFLDPDGSASSATVSVIAVELLILDRACLGSAPDSHAIGARVNPLDHIPCSLAPRKMVKLQRDEAGRLLLDADGKIKALADNDAAFDPSKPQYEYGIVVEHHDNFPAEGYVQIGREIIGYAQDRNGSTPLWTAKVPDPAAPGGYSEVTVLTGIKLLRQRYGTAREDYLTPGAADVVATVDPDEEEPLYYQDPAGSHSRRIVRLREVRYHDRYPISDTTGDFTPHRAATPVGYWEFAATVPGALWTQVQWTEAKYDEATGAIVHSKNDSRPLDANDPWDIQLAAQVDSAPAWDDLATDATTGKPVAQPVRWSDVPSRSDVVYDPPGYRLKKPVIYLFDDPAANNYINAKDSSTPLGQYGDRIRLRVYFKWNPYQAANGAAPNYNIPWRTPWVDAITLRYKAPTHVMEHREMPY